MFRQILSRLVRRRGTAEEVEALSAQFVDAYVERLRITWTDQPVSESRDEQVDLVMRTFITKYRLAVAAAIPPDWKYSYGGSPDLDEFLYAWLWERTFGDNDEVPKA